MITGKILKYRGWPEGRVIGHAKTAADRLEHEGWEREAILARFDDVLTNPDAYAEDDVLGATARELIGLRKREEERTAVPVLHAAPLPYDVWGAEQIDPGAIAQMDAAMRLPVTVAGALMPDAHVGYGLPIGGVLATENAVIPYAVGVDIACRMRLSVYPQSPIVLGQEPKRFERALLDRTYFGAGVANPLKPEHEVLDAAAWQNTRLLHGLQNLAGKQLGHQRDRQPLRGVGIAQRRGVRSAAGSAAGRVPGAALAQRVAWRGLQDRQCLLAARHADSGQSRRQGAPPGVALPRLRGRPGVLARHGARRPLRLGQPPGDPPQRGARRRPRGGSSGGKPPQLRLAGDGARRGGNSREVIVHRKGATPAGPGVLGIIPGSMGDPGFVVRGRGEARSLASASHGAGRAMSRRKALEGIPKADRDRYLTERGVKLLGGGIDESPQAYKNINDVIAAQSDLVDIIARFTPRIVRMASEPGDI